MIIKTFVEGPISANNYLLVDEKTNEAILIDCSSSREGFINEIKNMNVNLKYILLTHGHFDHILGIDTFHSIFNAPVYVGKDDNEQIDFCADMAEKFGRMNVEAVKTELHEVKEGDEFRAGDIVLKAISTPGHTKGGMSYLSSDGKLFSGDTLFKGSVGRFDLPGGNWQELLFSVKNKLFSLADEVEVFPGHGDKTTIEYEKKYNEVI